MSGPGERQGELFAHGGQCSVRVVDKERADVGHGAPVALETEDALAVDEPVEAARWEGTEALAQWCSS